MTLDRRGDYLLPIKDFRTRWRQLASDVGCAHLSPHKLRHLFGTKLVSPENQAHISIADAAELMCQKDKGQTILTRYVHVSRRPGC